MIGGVLRWVGRAVAVTLSVVPGAGAAQVMASEKGTGRTTHTTQDPKVPGAGPKRR